MGQLSRIAAAAAVIVALAWPGSSAFARCNEGDAGCTTAAQEAPMKLDSFMQTWKPVGSAKKTTKKVRSAKRNRAASAKLAKPKPAATAQAAVAAPAAAIPASPELTAQGSESAAPAPAETTGIGVVAFEDKNELDAALDQVQVASAGDWSEIDLSAKPPAETAGQSVTREPPPADSSWIAKLLLAMAGTIAAVGATRYMLA